jgi:DGQHR domain-containing protein
MCAVLKTNKNGLVSRKRKLSQTTKKNNDKVDFFEIPVIRKQQKDVVYYSGEMSVKDLKSIAAVAKFDSSKEGKFKNYQRYGTEKRGDKFGVFMTGKDNTCVTEIMLNDRDSRATFIPLKSLYPKLSNDRFSSTWGILRIPKDISLFVYDGQTRMSGYSYLLEFEKMMHEKGEKVIYQSLKVPFCLEQGDYYEEVARFLQHNGRATKVSNAHKASVIYGANARHENIHDLTKKEKVYALTAGVVEELNSNTSSPWYNKIIMPDTSHDKAKNLISSLASFHTGMEKIIEWMNSNYWSPETSLEDKKSDLSDISIIFWHSIKRTCPKIWKNPDNYTMLRSQGISALSRFMKLMFQDFFLEGRDWSVNNLTQRLKKSSLLKTPKGWEVGGKISKRGGNYTQLDQLAQDIYMEIRNNMTK